MRFKSNRKSNAVRLPDKVVHGLSRPHPYCNPGTLIMARFARLALWTALLFPVLLGCQRHTGLSGNSGEIADFLAENPGSDLGTEVEGGDR
ncbi:hypothetical protein CKO51_03585 [Rhodopirellula sp. SM50]|nr:hypothetical protein CKO51_03585 [Rhodopirellula sp. SM50]